MLSFFLYYMFRPHFPEAIITHHHSSLLVITHHHSDDGLWKVKRAKYVIKEKIVTSIILLFRKNDNLINEWHNLLQL